MRTLMAAALVAALLSGCDPGSKTNPVNRLNVKDKGAREKAAEELVAQGKDAVPAVIDLMQRGDLTDAMTSAGILARIGGPSVEPLEAYVKDGSKKNRGWACWALGEIGPAAKDALPALKAAEKEASLRNVAAEAIAKIEKR